MEIDQTNNHNVQKRVIAIIKVHPQYIKSLLVATNQKGVYAVERSISTVFFALDATRLCVGLVTTSSLAAVTVAVDAL